jgi:hypothetical protein
VTSFRHGGNKFLQLSFQPGTGVCATIVAGTTSLSTIEREGVPWNTFWVRRKYLKASIIYNARPAGHHHRPFGETDMPQVSQPADESHKIMGDKSPKSNQKKSSQKQAMASRADQQKKQAAAAKQSAGKNR